MAGHGEGCDGGRDAGIDGFVGGADAAAAIPRDYNFADDLFRRFRDSGWIEQDRLYRSARHLELRRSWSSAPSGSARCCGRSGIRPGERMLICLTDTIDWPTAFLGAINAGVVAVPVNTLMTEDDYRFMLADSRRAGAGGLAGAASEIRELIIPDAPEFHLIVIVGRHEDSLPHQSFEMLIEAPRPMPSPRRRPATTSRSGSTPRARPASRRRRCMCMPTCG